MGRTLKGILDLQEVGHVGRTDAMKGHDVCFSLAKPAGQEENGGQGTAHHQTAQEQGVGPKSHGVYLLGSELREVVNGKEVQAFWVS
jgi:hypothetical protein